MRNTDKENLDENEIASNTLIIILTNLLKWIVIF